jgi:hypothetical protein
VHLVLDHLPGDRTQGRVDVDRQCLGRHHVAGDVLRLLGQFVALVVAVVGFVGVGPVEALAALRPRIGILRVAVDDVAQRQHADDVAALVGHRHAADPVLGQQPFDVGQRRVRGHRDDVPLHDFADPELAPVPRRAGPGGACLVDAVHVRLRGCASMPAEGAALE